MPFAIRCRNCESARRGSRAIEVGGEPGPRVANTVLIGPQSLWNAKFENARVTQRWARRHPGQDPHSQVLKAAIAYARKARARASSTSLSRWLTGAPRRSDSGVAGTSLPGSSPRKNGSSARALTMTAAADVIRATVHKSCR